MDTRNSKEVESFVAYCKAHPEERFWQALRNWSSFNFILGSKQFGSKQQNYSDLVDTFYFEGKDK